MFTINTVIKNTKEFVGNQVRLEEANLPSYSPDFNIMEES